MSNFFYVGFLRQLKLPSPHVKHYGVFGNVINCLFDSLSNRKKCRAEWSIAIFVEMLKYLSMAYAGIATVSYPGFECNLFFCICPILGVR